MPAAAPMDSPAPVTPNDARGHLSADFSPGFGPPARAGSAQAVRRGFAARTAPDAATGRYNGDTASRTHRAATVDPLRNLCKSPT